MKLFQTLVSLLPLSQVAVSLAVPDVNGLVRREDPDKQEKYFHEPPGGQEEGHYDVRYFNGLVPYEEHRPVLRHLIRSYLSTLRKLNVETWLAHGTLLGWWWNGRIMPWDYDLDVQVSTASLYYLGKHHNRTQHEYSYRDEVTGETRTKTYMLDVNPHHVDRDRGNGRNIIDARWIDISNGAFVDITGLAERNPSSEPGIWSCKNFHRYRTTDLYPMRESEFEGVPAIIPYSFDRILTEEYGTKSLVQTEWLGHRWEPEIKEWIKMPEPPKEENQEQKPEEHKEEEQKPEEHKEDEKKEEEHKEEDKNEEEKKEEEKKEGEKTEEVKKEEEKKEEEKKN